MKRVAKLPQERLLMSHPSRVRELKLVYTDELEKVYSRTPPGCVN